MTKIEYQQIYDIVGAAMEVHQVLGRGLEEPIYQEALKMELDDRGIAAEREKRLTLYYKGRRMQKTYLADFYSEGVVVELKSCSSLISEHRAQLFNYMRITKADRGVLINFGEPSLRAERYLYLPEEDDFVLLSKENYKDYIVDL